MRSPSYFAALITSSLVLALGIPEILTVAVQGAIAQERITQSTESSAALRHEGLRLAYAGQLFTALERMERALALARSNDDQAEEADTLAAIAQVQIALNEESKGTDTAQQALALYKSLNNKTGESEALRVLATSQFDVEPLETVIATAEQALAAAEASSSPVQQGLVLVELGAYSVLAQEHKKGLGYLEKALILLETEPTTVEEQFGRDYSKPFALIWIANAQVELEAEQVISTLDDAIALSHSTSNVHAEGAALYVKGLRLAEKGEIDESLLSYQQAAAVLAKTDHRPILNNTLLATSRAYRLQGYNYMESEAFDAARMSYQQATETAQSALEIARVLGEPIRVSNALTHTAWAYIENSAFFVNQTPKLLEEKSYELSYKQLDSAVEVGQQGISFAVEALELVPNIQSEETIRGTYQAVDRAYAQVGQAYQQKVYAYFEEGKFEAAVVAQKNAIEPFKTTLSYSLESGDEDAIFRNKVQLSLAYGILSQAHEALEQYEAGVATAKLAVDAVEGTVARDRVLKSSYTLVSHYYYLSELSLVNKDYAKAVEYSEQALDYAQRSLVLAEKDVQVAGEDFPEGMSFTGIIDSEEKRQAAIRTVLGQTKVIYSQLSFAANDQDDHKKTIEYAQKILEIEEQLGDLEGEFLQLGTIGQSYTLLGQYDKALLAAQRAEAIAQDLNSPEYLLRAKRNIAHIYDRWGKYPKAIEIYKTALTLAKQQNNKINELLILGNLSVLDTAQGRYQAALEALDNSLTIIRSLRKQVEEASSIDELDGLCSTGSQSQDDLQLSPAADDNRSAFGEAISNNSIKSRRHTCLNMMWGFEEKNLNNTATVYNRQGRYQDALERYAQALDIAKERGGLSNQGDIISNIGVAHYDAGNYNEALRFARQALTIREKIDEPVAVVNSLNNLSVIYQEQGKYNKALSVSETALEILQESEYKPLEAFVLSNISLVYREQGRYSEAESLQKRALSIEQALALLPNQASSLTNLSSLEIDRGNYPAALAYLEVALKTYQEIGARALEGGTLTFMGRIRERQGNYSEAFALHEEALAIAQSLEDKDDEAAVLSAIGRTYDKLGQYEQAQASYQDALDIFKRIGDVTGESSVLNQLGENANRQALYPEALAFYEEALQIHRRTGSAIRESRSLLNLGIVQINIEDVASAEDALEKSLAIQERIGVQRDRAETLAGLARVERKKNNLNKASSLLQEALVLNRELGDMDGEAAVLSQIGELFSQKAQPELAIIFYKQSINLIEGIRADISGLPSEFQQSFAGTVTSTYRNLADLLIQQDRILEAQKVLDLLKVQELEDYLQNVRGNAVTASGIEYNKPEQAFLAQYQQQQESAISLMQDFAKLNSSFYASSPADEARRLELKELSAQLTDLFDSFMNDKDVKALVAELRRVEGLAPIDLAGLSSQRDELAQLEAVILYPLILDDRIELVLATGSAEPLHRTVENVTREQLNQAVFDFQRALRDPSSDAVVPAQKLYKWLIEPIEDDLAAADVETILYSPDGVLRYIPLAALHDGEQWIAERFEINNITSKSLEDIGKQLDSQTEPRVIAGAFADPSVVHPVGESRYRGLPFAGQEVESLAETVSSIKPFFDREFSFTTIESEASRANILHLATHASFVSTDPSESFILFGDGGLQTVEDILKWEISNIDLVVLSACETGLGDVNQDGKQILGLGYQFQTRGANAVIASLWQVNDGSTQILMNDFYKNLDQGMHKNGAVQKAQLAMIKSDLTVTEAMSRSGLEALDVETGEPAVAATGKINHPHYWAPFILIGNGL